MLGVPTAVKREVGCAAAVLGGLRKRGICQHACTKGGPKRQQSVSQMGSTLGWYRHSRKTDTRHNHYYPNTRTRHDDLANTAGTRERHILDRRDLDDITCSRSMDDVAIADIHTNMGSSVEEHQVARL